MSERLGVSRRTISYWQAHFRERQALELPVRLGECHDNVVSSKIVDCTVNYFLLEDSVVAAFIVSSFGTFVMG